METEVISLEFTKTAGIYNPGDFAGFDAETAAKYLKAGVAKRDNRSFKKGGQ